MPVVEAASLVKAHGTGRGAHRVLNGASIAIEAGELVAVVGRSGSGKSTLIHLLGALDRPDAGTITLAGRRIENAPERELVAIRRDLVGLVFQFFHLVPELTGEENVMLPARLPGANGAVERSRELIERLQLTDAAMRRPHELSGGEQQRLALARALVRDPAAVTIAGASLLLGTAVTVGYGLVTGFDRAANVADLPDVIAQFDEHPISGLNATLRALPNVAAVAYRSEFTHVPLSADGHFTRD